MSENAKDSGANSVSHADHNDEEVGMQKKSPSAQTIQGWLVTRLSEVLGVESQDIDIREPFTWYGLTSRDAVGLSGDLEDWLGRRLSPTLAYEYPTIETLARHLAGEGDDSDLTGKKRETETNCHSGYRLSLSRSRNRRVFLATPSRWCRRHY
jgi:acyl carrier protein